MVKYYHYTSAEAAVAILKSNTLLISTTNHAVFGPGVYFTSFAPTILEAGQIYQNNWGVPMSGNMIELSRMCACFEIDYGGDKMVRAPNLRDVWLFKDEHMEDLVKRIARVYILVDFAKHIQSNAVIVNLKDKLTWCELKNNLFSPFPTPTTIVTGDDDDEEDEDEDEAPVSGQRQLHRRRIPPRGAGSPILRRGRPAPPKAAPVVKSPSTPIASPIAPPPVPASASTLVISSLLSPLPDVNITASTTFQNRADHSTARSRLHTSLGSASAWCANVCDGNQWLQADLTDPMATVHRVLTQGRADHVQFVGSYRIGISHDGVTFAYLPQVFTANTDQHTVVTNEMNPPLRGRFVRLQPVTWQGHISMRWDLFGQANINIVPPAAPPAPVPLPVVTKYHGDPSRENKFWVYPRNKKLVTPTWDCYNAIDLCNNHKLITNRNGHGVQEYQCLGHKQ